MPDANSGSTGYVYDSSGAAHTEAYLWEPIIARCQRLGVRKVLDLGCGNGALCGALAEAGFVTHGCDPSEDGIRFAVAAVPRAVFKQAGVYDDPASLGEAEFDAVISTEVVEHLFHPRALPRFARAVLRPGGHLFISTPYHGYGKNLALSLFDKWDFHHTPFWDGGHIKFWSRRTLTQLLVEEGFQVTEFLGAGRLPWLWKSMILVAVKPSTASSLKS